MTSFTRRTSRLTAGLGIAGATVLLLAGPAAADTSNATARAALVEVLGAPVLDTGTEVASSDGTGGDVLSSDSTSILGGQTLLVAGVLAQAALARANGTSAACAGAVGDGGTIQIGANNACTATIGTPGGVQVNLNAGIATLGADAIYAECTATTAGETGFATLLNADILLLGAPLPIDVAVNPAPNTPVLNIPGIASLILNEQSPTPDGGLMVRALHLTLADNIVTGDPLGEVIIGEVTCGPNAVTGPISIFSGPALPLAATAAVGVGAVTIIRRRRQTA